MTDEHWMSIALDEARAAAAAGDVPVGAVIVIGDRIVGRGHNRREVDRDPTAHAEIVALRAAAEVLQQWRGESAACGPPAARPAGAGARVYVRGPLLRGGLVAP